MTAFVAPERLVRARASSTPAPRAAEPDLAALAAALRARVEGEVRFDAGSRALYATDASNYRRVPIGVVVPRSIDDVLAAVATCRAFGAPVLSRGGGTSLAGQCCNAAVVLDWSKYLHRVLAVDPAARLARVQPGAVLDALRGAAAAHGLTFGPDPATHDRCTLGGMLGNNSCGVHSVTAGRTADNVHELEVLTYDGLRLRVGATPEAELERIVRAGGRRGEIYGRLRALRDRYAARIRERFPRIPRRVSGYNLDELLPERGFHLARALVGTEGTCVTVLEASVHLVPSPRHRALLVLGYPDVYTAADDVPDVLASGPIGLEGFDDRMIAGMTATAAHPDDARMLPPGRGWLLAEFGGETPEQAAARARALRAALETRGGAPSHRLVTDPSEAQRLWAVREGALGATAKVPGEPDAWPGWEDSAVPPSRLGEYLRDLRDLLARHGYSAAMYGHFGDGCVHCRIDFDLRTRRGIERYRAFVTEAAETVVRLGGSLSGEHGDGQARAELLPIMYGEELVDAFREFKSIWDPDAGMNPGKVVAPRRLTDDLRERFAAAHGAEPGPTHFRFGDDAGRFARAADRCVGVGACRREAGGTMCPSYRATREEMHSTRGRARLLFEMLADEPLTGGWKSEAVREALDLCLACKGCKRECPVHVDMATYKAEFLAHYYDGRLRPRAAYAFGLIDVWARLAARAPGVANALTQTPGLRAIARAVAGVAPERRIPPFAPRTFTAWFGARPSRNAGGPPVVLWPDTFNNHFHPETAAAAVEVLESAGFAVLVPRRAVCCGRPLYDYGMLDRARRYLRATLDALRPALAAGVPVVGLEPSCVAVFRDELVGLLPDDPDARRLAAQAVLFSEFVAAHAERFAWPRFERRAVVHGHCHHKAIMTMEAEQSALDRLGVACEAPESGCCGMAGAFGFEADHYDVSVACGERALLPSVRAAPPEALVIADGFSCREQIAQGTARRGMHLAEVMHLALRSRPGDLPAAYPERDVVPVGPAPWRRARRLGVAAAVLLAAAGALLALKRARA